MPIKLKKNNMSYIKCSKNAYKIEKKEMLK